MYKRSNSPSPFVVLVIYLCSVGTGFALVALGSTARLVYEDATIQAVYETPTGIELVVEAQGAVETFRCYEDRTLFHLCQALEVGDVVSLVGQPQPSDADETTVELLSLTVRFLQLPEDPEEGEEPVDVDGRGR